MKQWLIWSTWGLTLASMASAQQVQRIESFDPEKKIRKIELIHYVGDKAATQGPKPTCYAFLGGGGWTNLPVTIVVNPTNSLGLSESFVVQTVQRAASTWNQGTKKHLFDPGIVVDYTVETPFAQKPTTIAFWEFPSTEILASTSISFDSETLQVIDYHMLLNSLIPWGDATVNPAVVDLESVVVHELGHALGLGDVFDPGCTEATMYVFGFFGNTDKRTLEKADVKAARSLYKGSGR